MSKISVKILIVALCLLGVFGGLLAAFTQLAHEEFSQSITLEREGVTSSVVSIDDLALSPNTKQEYTVQLRCRASGAYTVSLLYEEKTDGGLKPFVNVTIFANENQVFKGTLAALLACEEIPTFETELTALQATQVRIVYSMPQDVGNEAQDTFADFDLHITIQKE